jgi:hypothetical protein
METTPHWDRCMHYEASSYQYSGRSRKSEMGSMTFELNANSAKIN